MNQNTKGESTDRDPWYLDFIFALVFFAAALYTNSELSDLEHGTVDSVKMWPPLIWLYHHFGRIGPVVVIALCGIVPIVTGLRKLTKPKQ